MSAVKNPIDVAAALIFRNGKILVTQRHAHSHLGGFWEFPGGKRERNETFEQCLVREIHEELGAEISINKLFEEIVHTYPNKIVRLRFFSCRLVHGEPQPLGCTALEWIGESELDDYKFPPADTKLLLKLKKSPEFSAKPSRKPF